MLSRPQDHSAGGGIKSTKNPNDPIGNRNRDLPASTAIHFSRSKIEVHQQVTKTQRGSRDISLFVTWAIVGGGGSQAHAPATLPPGKQAALIV
jgi:hypothetical protein